MTHVIAHLEDAWEEIGFSFAFSVGIKGSHKELTVKTRFDGHGNSIVRYVVTDHGQATTYEKFDAATEAYNRAP